MVNFLLGSELVRISLNSFESFLDLGFSWDYESVEDAWVDVEPLPHWVFLDPVIEVQNLFVDEGLVLEDMDFVLGKLDLGCLGIELTSCLSSSSFEVDESRSEVTPIIWS